MRPEHFILKRLAQSKLWKKQTNNLFFGYFTQFTDPSFGCVKRRSVYHMQEKIKFLVDFNLKKKFYLSFFFFYLRKYVLKVKYRKPKYNLCELLAVKDQNSAENLSQILSLLLGTGTLFRKIEMINVMENVEINLFVLCYFIVYLVLERNIFQDQDKFILRNNITDIAKRSSIISIKLYYKNTQNSGYFIIKQRLIKKKLCSKFLHSKSILTTLGCAQDLYEIITALEDYIFAYFPSTKKKLFVNHILGLLIILIHNKTTKNASSCFEIKIMKIYSSTNFFWKITYTLILLYKNKTSTTLICDIERNLARKQWHVRAKINRGLILRDKILLNQENFFLAKLNIIEQKINDQKMKVFINLKNKAICGIKEHEKSSKSNSCLQVSKLKTEFAFVLQKKKNSYIDVIDDILILYNNFQIVDLVKHRFSIGENITNQRVTAIKKIIFLLFTLSIACSFN